MIDDSQPTGTSEQPGTPPRQALVCQNITCRQQGAAAVLAAFRAQPASNVLVVNSGCLGQCGNGPMVLVLPEKIWYDRVHPSEALVIIQQHLQAGQPVEAMLYRKFHPHPRQKQAAAGRLVMLGVAIMVIMVLLWWGVGSGEWGV